MIVFAGTPRLADYGPYRDQRVASEENLMCPLCITTALLIAGSATSTGGLAAIAIKKFSVKNSADIQPGPNPPKQLHQR
jgi:hypothetical protein